jgi:hypothetical protein
VQPTAPQPRHLFKLKSKQDNEEGTDITHYRQLVGMLLWLALGTCPDILFATIALSMHSVNSARRHRKGLERILGYLKRIPKKGITYCHNPNADPVVFTDVARQPIWLGRLIADFGQSSTPRVVTDCLPARFLANNETYRCSASLYARSRRARRNSS